MANPILMPALSPTMKEGKIVKWLKSEGENVVAGDVLCEIETDKATLELESVDEGILGKIVHQAGAETIAVNQTIGFLVDKGESVEGLEASSPEPKAASDDKPSVAAADAKQTAPEATAPDAKKTAPEAKQTAPETTAPDAKQTAPETINPQTKSTSASSNSETTNKTGRVFASPLAKRLAKEKNINISSVKGSGPRGRVIANDIENYKGESTSSVGQIDDQELSYDLIPHSTMRLVIAKRLSEAKATIPHFYLSAEFELDNLMEARAKINEALAKEYAKEEVVPKISVNDLITKACAKALVKVPSANVSWSDEGLKQFKSVHISIAVATPSGLITPIIKNPDKLGMLEISTTIKDLALRARKGKLLPEEYQGGGFTISNLGMFGIKNFQAIINPPQACILAIGAGTQKLALNDDDEVVTKTVVEMTLSVDHRAVDGAIGANYLNALKGFVENPSLMLV